MGRTESYITNRDSLLDHGHRSARKAALDILDAALEAVDPYVATKKHVRLQGSILRVFDRDFDLNSYRRIIILGSGKATFRQAYAMEEILRDRISDGFIAVKYGQAEPLDRIRVVESSHPTPDEAGFEATEEVFRLADSAGADDLVICLMSGGSSACCPAPVAGITRRDKMDMHRVMVRSGADITEVMAVRGHLSAIKGGRLMSRLAPATIIALTVSDAIGDPMEWNTAWTHPDSSTFEDCLKVLHKYDLRDLVPDNVRAFFSEFSPEKETAKEFVHDRVFNFMTVRTTDLWQAAAEAARTMGLAPLILTTRMKGESREVGRTLAAIAAEAARSGQPIAPPCALIAAGESGVRIIDTPKGPGGANQELACGAALDLTLETTNGLPLAIAALDTDGTDGPTDIAGGLVDFSTPIRTAETGRDLYRELLDHDASRLLTGIGDAIITGHTGSNVNDVVVMVVLKEEV